MNIYQLFWNKLEKSTAIPYLILFLIIIGVEIAGTIYLPHTRKPVFDSLEKFNYGGFIAGLVVMFIVNAVVLGVQGFKTWVEQRLSFDARNSLMKTIKKTWILKGATREISNPCSRLNDDTRISTETAIIVFTECFISLSIVIGVILGMTQWPLLLSIALLYSVVSIGMALLFRKPIVSRKVASLNAEGNHRVALTQISWGKGDFTSKAKWVVVRETFFHYIAILRTYKLFMALQQAITLSLPFIVMSKGYFAHIYTLGDVMQGTLSFDLLVLNAAVWVQLYPQVTEAQASFIRVKELFLHVHKD